MRTGVQSASAQQSFPEEFVVFPQSSLDMLHSGASLVPHYLQGLSFVGSSLIERAGSTGFACSRSTVHSHLVVASDFLRLVIARVTQELIHHYRI